MQLLNKREMNKRQKLRWLRQYGKRNDMILEGVIKAMQELPEYPTDEELSEASNNRCRGWPVPECSECKQELDEVVEFDNRSDPYADTVHLCAHCLMKAMVLINP